MLNSYENLIKRFHDYFTEDGNMCVALGLDKNLDRLPEISEESYERNLTDGKNLLKDLQEFDKTSLTFDQKLDLDLALNLIEQDIFQANIKYGDCEVQEKMPTAAVEISDAIFTLFVNDPRDPSERLNNILSRIKQTPHYLKNSLECYNTPVKRWVEMEIESMNEVPDLYGNILSWAENCGYYKTHELVEAIHQAKVAINSYLEELQKLSTSTDFTLGETQTRELLRHNGIELSPEQLKLMAVNFVHQNNKEIEDLRVTLCKKYDLNPTTPAETLQNFLNKKFKVEVTGEDYSNIFNHYQKEKTRILDFIRSRDLFPIMPDQDVLIIKTPKFMEPTIPAGAMMPPPAFRDGVKKSIIYLTITDEESLDEHTQLSIPCMLAHEAYAGHHLAYATAYNNSSVVRKHSDSLVTQEGWTTMLEIYMLEQGYMNDLTDEAYFITKREFNRLGARVLIDLYFMTGNLDYINVGLVEKLNDQDPFVNAGRLLKELTGFTDDRCVSELQWYSQAPGYPLSYLCGNFLVKQLKQDMANKTGLKGIDLDRLFHKFFLDYSTVPPSFMRKVFKFHGLI